LPRFLSPWQVQSRLLNLRFVFILLLFPLYCTPAAQDKSVLENMIRKGRTGDNPRAYSAVNQAQIRQHIDQLYTCVSFCANEARGSSSFFPILPSSFEPLYPGDIHCRRLLPLSPDSHARSPHPRTPPSPPILPPSFPPSLPPPLFSLFSHSGRLPPYSHHAIFRGGLRPLPL